MNNGSKKMTLADRIGIIIIAIVAVIAIAVGIVTVVKKGDSSKKEKTSNSQFEKEQKLYIEVSKKDADEKLAELTAEIEKRADLIPNFIATAKGYENYDQATVAEIKNARKELRDASDMITKAMALRKLDEAIDVWVNAVTEAYPEIRSDKLYIALQDELKHTEAHISTARQEYNEAAKKYNKAISKFSDYKAAELFVIADKPQTTPEVQ